MRAMPRFLIAPLAALGTGLAASFGAAAWLRSALPAGDLLFAVAPPAKLGLWILAGAHRVPLSVRAGVRPGGGLSERLGPLGDLLGRRLQLPEFGASSTVLLVPLTILVLAAGVSFLVARASGASSAPEALLGSLGAGVVYAGVLAALLAGGSSRVGFGGRFVDVGVSVRPQVGQALVLGFLVGGLSALAGGLSSPGALPPLWRAVAGGWWRGLAAGAGATVLGVGVAGLAGLGTGRLSVGAGSGSLVALGVVLLGLNGVAAGLVLAHGASMTSALAAGPFARWGRIDYLHFGPSGRPASPAWWLGLAIPIVAGLAAGRHASRRDARVPGWVAAAGFGVAWGLTLALLAWLLRVEMLSDFALAKLSGQGSGGASINPGLALVLGAAWGTAAAYVGVMWGRAGGASGPADGAAPRPEARAPVVQPDPPPSLRSLPTVATIPPPGSATPEAIPDWTCPSCQSVNGAGHRFCGSCGYRGW